MIIREIIMWLSIMRNNLKEFPEVGNENKIKALSEALVIIHKYQKIKDIVINGDDTHYKLLMQIKEVVEDGNDD